MQCTPYPAACPSPPQSCPAAGDQPIPSYTNRVINVTDWGAVADGKTGERQLGHCRSALGRAHGADVLLLTKGHTALRFSPCRGPT